MKTVVTCLLLAAGFAGSAVAQAVPAYHETGVITMTLGTDEISHYTTWSTVPGDAEREVHSASWVILKPMLLGGVNITPDDVFVTLSSRDTISPTAGQPELRVEFSLDPVTLDLKADPAVDLRYFPGQGEEINYYALTHGRFQIESVTRADEDTLSIVATVDGELSAQQTEEPVHNPADVLPLKARFDLRQVSNRGSIPLP